MKNSFVLFNDLIDTVSILEDEEAGALFKMILNYENGRELSKDIKCESIPALIAFTFVQRQLDRLDEQYEKTTQARIEAGRKGAERSPGWKVTAGKSCLPAKNRPCSGSS